MKKIRKLMALGVGVCLMVLLQTSVFAAVDNRYMLTHFFPDYDFADEVVRRLGVDSPASWTIARQEELDQIIKMDGVSNFNTIESIEGVRHLRNLESLNMLYRCNIKEIPAEIGELSKLQRLGLVSNELVKISPEIGQLWGLTSLTLGGNQLETIPPEIGQLSGLTSLTLSGSQIKEIPPEIGNLSGLTSLTLSGSQIKEIPPEIGKLSELTSLTLSGNQLEEIPPEIGNLSGLTSLTLNGNQIKEIPPEIGQLSGLTSLTLNGNQIEEIPPEIGNLSGLISLDLSENAIEEIPVEIANLKQLKSLSLADNRISIIPDAIRSVTSLSKLSMDHNQIEVIPNMEGLNQLSQLSLKNNKIQKISESLGNLPALEHLNLNHNQIEVIPDNFCNVAARGSLDLSKNLIKELPDNFGNTQINGVVLSENQLTRLPDSFGTVQPLNDTIFDIFDQQVQLNPVSVLQGETVTSDMLVPEIVFQLTEYQENKEHLEYFGSFGCWEIVTPNQQMITRVDQDGIEDMSELFQEPGVYEVRYMGDGYSDDYYNVDYCYYRYYHAYFYGNISSSISVTVLPEQKKTHQVDVTVRYLDDVRPEETNSYTVNDGEAFAQEIHTLDGYALANMGLLRAAFDFDYDTDLNVVSLSPVYADHSILLEFDKAQYRVRLKTTYLDGSQADNTQISWIPYKEDYQQSFQIAEGYEIANVEQLAGAGIEIDEASKTVRLGGVTQNCDITLELQKKSCEVVVRVVYEDGAYPDQVSTYPVPYGESFKGEFSYDENYAIRKVSFNATGVSVNRISKQIIIGSVKKSIEITIVVR